MSPGRMQMRLGHSSAGDAMIVTWPVLPPIGVVPSSQGRPMCLSSQAPPMANIVSTRAASAKLRVVREIEGGREGNLMGTPWRPVGSRGGASVPTAARTQKPLKAAPCYLHDRSCQAPRWVVTRAANDYHAHLVGASIARELVTNSRATRSRIHRRMAQLIS